MEKNYSRIDGQPFEPKQTPRLKLALEPTGLNLGIDPRELAFLDDVASWAHGAPPFHGIPELTRSAFLKRKEPFAFNGVNYSTVQMKGVGYEQKSRLNIPGLRILGTTGIPDVQHPFKAGTRSFSSFGEKGEALVCFHGAEAIGGMTFEGQYKEVQNTIKLQVQGILCPLPLRLARLDGLQWQGSDLGMQSLLVPNESHTRIMDAMNASFQKLSMDDDDDAVLEALDSFLEVFRAIATKQRELVEKAGMVHTQPHLQNFSINGDGKLVTHDLEAVVDMEGFTPIQSYMTVRTYFGKIFSVIMNYILLQQEEKPIFSRAVVESLIFVLYKSFFHEKGETMKSLALSHANKTARTFYLHAGLNFETAMSEAFTPLEKGFDDLYQKSDLPKQGVNFKDITRLNEDLFKRLKSIAHWSDQNKKLIQSLEEPDGNPALVNVKMEKDLGLTPPSSRPKEI